MTTPRRFPKEFKDSILRELQPPQNKSVGEISERENIPKSTLYGWVRRAREKGQLIPNNGPANVDKWRQKDKARIVMETYSMNEQELGEYCRKLGLYVTEVKRWHQIFESAFDSRKPAKELEQALNIQKAENVKLEQELRYKEKALAEAAALLVLKKKIDSIWGDPEVD